MRPEIVVIGAGVIGLTTAASLARRGAMVTVLERGVVGGESSWAGAGILSALPPWGYNPFVSTIIEEGRRAWPNLARSIQQETGIDPEYRVCGMLALEVPDPCLAQTWCDNHDWPCVTGAQAIEQSWPNRMDSGFDLAFGDHTAVWLPHVAQVRNPRLVRGLARLAEGMGVRIMTGQSEITMRAQGNTVTHIRTAQAEYACTHAVICAGAWSAQLLSGLLADAPLVAIKPIRGQMLLFRDAPGRLPCIIYRQGKYLVPRQDGHILAGSTLEDVGFDKSTTPEALSELRRFAWETVPWLRGTEPIMHWAGLRPGSVDNVPHIGPVSEMRNLYLNSGHFRYGVTMAPAAAERLVDGLWESHGRVSTNSLDMGHGHG